MSANATATDYHVDTAAGIDSNNGTSAPIPWRTPTKMTGITFVSGDKVLMRLNCKIS